MPEITLTAFADFIVSLGTSRLSEVRRIKAQFESDYEPYRDYYKEIRDGIVDYHHGRLSAIDDAVDDADVRKEANYELVADGYKRFLKKSSFQDPFKAPSAKWSHGDLEVTINPELGLDLNGEPTTLKLYFKAREMSRQRADVILYLMHTTLKPHRRGPLSALIDIRRGKLYTYRASSQDLEPLLAGEASALCEMWKLTK